MSHLQQKKTENEEIEKNIVSTKEQKKWPDQKVSVYLVTVCIKIKGIQLNFGRQQVIYRTNK